MGRLADGVVCNQCDYLLIEAEDKLEKHQDFRHGDAHVLQSARASLPRLATITIRVCQDLQQELYESAETCNNNHMLCRRSGSDTESDTGVLARGAGAWEC